MPRTIRKIRPSALVIVALVALVAACGGTGGGLGTVPPVLPTPSASGSAPPDLTPDPTVVPTSSPAPSADPTGSPGTTPDGAIIVRTYFVMADTVPEGQTGRLPDRGGLVPTLREVPHTVAVATAAMNQLLGGPTTDESDGGIGTAIKPGTRLLGLTITNGVATVDLSTEFDSLVGGLPNGIDIGRMRLAQVVYTLTQFSTVRSVAFQIEGQSITVFGSSGIKLDAPVGRSTFEGQLPAIFVDRPAWGAAIGNPARVTGNSDVFEATFRMALLDGSGKVLADEQVMATCGTGCRGTFETTLRYSVAKAQWGTLRAYNLSAKDGTREDIRDYPVWLTPAP